MKFRVLAMDDLSSAPKKALGALPENQRKTTELPTQFFL